MSDAAQVSRRQPWDRMDDEPDLWYSRFEVYLGLGPARSLRTAAGAWSEKIGRNYICHGEWTRQCRMWRWRERAQAWDTHQRELLAVAERNCRASLKGRRLDVIGDYLEVVCAVLSNANLEEADQQQSRQWLPQMSKMLLDLLEAERKECEGPTYAKGDPLNAAPITADDLRAAQRALDGQEDTKDAEDGGQTPTTGPGEHPFQRVEVPLYPSHAAVIEARHLLFVCTGPDTAPAPAPDLPLLREMRSATGLQFQRIRNATKRKFVDSLRRERYLRRPVELLHMALHASASGVQFADGLVDGPWLNERLESVQVLLIAAWDGSSDDSGVGWLESVPYVVTFDEAMDQEDAMVLAQYFWQNIALDMEPPEALEEALTHCTAGVGEQVGRWW